MQYSLLIRLGIMAVLLAILPAAVLAEEAYVQVQSTSIRTEPKIFSRSLATLSFGDRVTIEPAGKAPAGWVSIRTSRGAKGFVHSSALTSRRVVLAGRSSRGGVGEDSRDVVLAGKGFNKDVERRYAQEAAGRANFAAVDKMRQFRPAAGEVERFVAGGKLAS